MEDAQIRSRIEKLEDEERALRAEEEQAADVGREDALAKARDRLAEIKLELDQLWDFLRRREAARRAGTDVEGVQMRDRDTVEGYLN